MLLGAAPPPQGIPDPHSRVRLPRTDSGTMADAGAEIACYKSTYQDLAVRSIKVKADYYSQFCYSVVIT